MVVQATPKIKRLPPIWVATDSEWDDRVGWLSTSVRFPTGTVVYMTPDIPETIRQRVRTEADRLGVTLFFRDRGDGTNLVRDAMRHLGIWKFHRTIYLLMFYSAKDVEYALGWNPFQAALDDGKIRQRNNLAGNVPIPGGRQVHLKDLGGLWQKGLKDFASAMGIPSAEKDLMDPYKAKMLDGLTEHPETFLQYAVNDTDITWGSFERFIDHFRNLQRDCFGMTEDDLWTIQTIPMTIGSLVARTFERWLHRRCDPEVFEFCIRKLGILDQDTPRFKYSRHAFNAVVKGIDEPIGLRMNLVEGGFDELNHFLNEAKFAQTALNAGSVGWWAGRPTTTTPIYNALVTGGRCNNEFPTQYRVENASDIDIEACYGGSLRVFDYPIGLPTVTGTTANQTPETFGRWFDRHQSDLIPGLWQAFVSGPLGFQQDLIYSKLVKAVDIAKASQNQDDPSDIPDDFVLLRGGITNGTLTADVVRVLQAICTNQEWKQIRALKVVTAAAYLARHRVDTLEEWCDRVIRDPGSYQLGPNGVEVDTRTRHWVGIPLDDFVGKMVDRRIEYKARTETPDLSPEEWAHAKGMSETLKTTINTCYGILASRFFEIGNTIVANNITARARVGVWMLAKALGCRQSITDGGVYTPLAVCHAIGGKNPGLDTLSRTDQWHNPRRHRYHQPLTGWNSGEWPDQSTLDRLASEHVAAFWDRYGLEFPFDLKHKHALLEVVAYWGKADYAVRHPGGKVEHFVRGKPKKGSDHRYDPKILLLDNILAGSDEFPAEMEFTPPRRLLKVGLYCKAQTSKGYHHLKDKRPGDAYQDPPSDRPVQ